MSRSFIFAPVVIVLDQILIKYPVPEFFKIPYCHVVIVLNNNEMYRGSILDFDLVKCYLCFSYDLSYFHKDVLNQ